LHAEFIAIHRTAVSDRDRRGAVRARASATANTQSTFIQSTFIAQRRAESIADALIKSVANPRAYCRTRAAARAGGESQAFVSRSAAAL
jgi:hypothetical protein